MDVGENLETGSFDIISNVCKCVHNSMETMGKKVLISVSMVNNNYQYIVPLQYFFYINIRTEIQPQC